MEQKLKKQKKRIQRKKRIRMKVAGTGARPRMSVFRSLKHMQVQLIDDAKGVTILGVSTQSKEIADSLKISGNVDAAGKLGELVAAKALEKNITTVVFDRNGCLYHGRVKALAESARAKGLQF